MKRLIPIALFALALFLLAGIASADTVDGVTFTLVQADLSGSPGDILTWQYDVTNNSGEDMDIYANSISADLFNNGSGDASPFDYFGAGVLADGASLIGPLFAFDSDPSVPNSFNSGQFDLNVSLADATRIDLLANYSATITPGAVTPEPASLTLVATALAGLLALRRKLA